MRCRDLRGGSSPARGFVVASPCQLIPIGRTGTTVQDASQRVVREQELWLAAGGDHQEPACRPHVAACPLRLAAWPAGRSVGRGRRTVHLRAMPRRGPWPRAWPRCSPASADSGIYAKWPPRPISSPLPDAPCLNPLQDPAALLRLLSHQRGELRRLGLIFGDSVGVAGLRRIWSYIPAVASTVASRPLQIDGGPQTAGTLT